MQRRSPGSGLHRRDRLPGLACPKNAHEHLTTTVDGQWVVWAHKLARQKGDLSVPLTGGPGYPADARAECRVPGRPKRSRTPPIRGARAASTPCRAGGSPQAAAVVPGAGRRPPLPGADRWPPPHGADRGAVRTGAGLRAGLAEECCGGRSGRPWFASTGQPRSTGQQASRSSAAIPMIPTVASLSSPLPHLAIRGRSG